MIHSIIPLDVIFSTPSEYNFEYIQRRGCILEVQATENNQYKINRVISTNLKNYMDIQPGSFIK